MQLNVAGAPKLATPTLAKAKAKTGWFWHNALGEQLVADGFPVVREWQLKDYMPEGWSGTADWLLWSPEYQAWVLTDIKTTKGRSMPWVPKDDHIWQTSLYYHALEAAGLQIVKGVALFYLPLDLDHTRRKPLDTSYQVVEFDPIPWKKLEGEMKYRKKRADAYLETIPDLSAPDWKLGRKYITREENYHLLFLNKELEEPQPRVQKLSKAGEKYELKLVPHWSTDYCDYGEELCDCSTQGTTKIGEFLSEFEGEQSGGGQYVWIYKPRKGYEDIKPTEAPPSQRRRK